MATQKHSDKRDAIIRLLQSTKEHPDADWVYFNMRKEFPNISLGTVYRNLKQLSDNGTILRLETGSGTEHFDAFTHDHSHFVCTACNRIIDVDAELESIDRRAEEQVGGRIDFHRMFFYGRCKSCNNV
ncbi:MAG: transcriptional repressor [Clostridia bacterium]|nr:transcriptional repressor [Clostridia bacterium]